MSEENITLKPTQDEPTWKCGCCGFISKTEMKEYQIPTYVKPMIVCEVCSNTRIMVRSNRNDNFRILQIIAHVGMMIISRLDDIISNQSIIIAKLDRK